MRSTNSSEQTLPGVGGGGAGPEPIFFNHVPKCAGTSIGELLEMAYPASTVFTSKHVSPAAIRTTDGAELGAHRLIWGHFTDIGRRRAPGRYTIVSLREPWSRFRSLLRHALRETGEWKNFSILRPYAQTLDASILGGAEFQQMLRLLPTFTHLAPQNPENTRKTVRERVEEAERALETYDLIILDETIDSAARHLADRLGLPPVERAPRFNTAETWPDSMKADPPREHEALLGEWHEADRGFYERARERALEQARVIERPREEREARYAERLASLSVEREWSLDWTGVVLGAGWSAREQPGAVMKGGRRVFRQLIGERAFIDVPVAADGELCIELIFASSNEAQERLRVMVNGEPASWSRSLTISLMPAMKWKAKCPPSGGRGVRVEFLLEGEGIPPTARPWLLDLRVRSARRAMMAVPGGGGVGAGGAG